MHRTMHRCPQVPSDASSTPLYSRLGPLVVARTPHQRSLHDMEFLMQCLWRNDIHPCLVVDASGLPFPYNLSTKELADVPHVRLHWGREEEQAVPSPGLVNLFCDVALSHILQNPGKVVLVHDEHGLDRAAYLACHYLVRTMLKPLPWVMQTFCEVRPPGFLGERLPGALAAYYATPGAPQGHCFPVWEPVWEHVVAKVQQLCPNEHCFFLCMGMDAYACVDGRVWRTRFVVPPATVLVAGLHFLPYNAP